MPNNLPSPIPAGLDQNLKTLMPGSTVFAPTGKTRIPKEGDWVRAPDIHATMVKASCDWGPLDGVRQIYTRHDITTPPLHYVTPEMVEAVKSAYKRLAECGYWQASALLAAFAHILEAPFGSAQGEQEDKVNTCRDAMNTYPFGDRTPDEYTNRDAIRILADAIDSLRAEVRELKQSQMRSMP